MHKNMSQIMNAEDEIDLLDLARALWKKAVFIVIITILAGAIALSYAVFFVTPMYSSSVLMYVNNSNLSLGSASVRISTTELSAAQSLIDTYSVILKSRTTLEAVKSEAGLSYSYNTLKDMITSKAVNGTEIFEISVENKDPEEAKMIANTIAKVLPDKISDIVDNSSVRVVDYAVTNHVRISPSYSKTCLMGLLAGFVIACGICVIQYFLDDVIHNEDYLIESFDIPVLASIPDIYAKTNGKGYYSYGSGKEGK